jgi:hypothetical protein
LLFKQSQMGNKTHGRDSFHPHLHADRRWHSTLPFTFCLLKTNLVFYLLEIRFCFFKAILAYEAPAQSKEVTSYLRYKEAGCLESHIYPATRRFRQSVARTCWWLDGEWRTAWHGAGICRQMHIAGDNFA